MNPSIFHSGEIEVQQRAGVRQMAERIGRSIHDSMPPAAQYFISEQRFLVVGGADEAGRVWASLLSGDLGFVWAADEYTIRVATRPVQGDPLREVLRDGANVGMIALEPSTRRRMRVNGTVDVVENGLMIRVEQAYGNCPKYIQKREIQTSSEVEITEGVVSKSAELSKEQQGFIEASDTFFIASLAPEGSADASHRGGNPGFVRVESEKRLVFPDYSGNAMFNTLGNIQANPRAGLIFIDWKNGYTLQLSGTARVNWDAQRIHEFAGAERVVEFEIEAVVAIQGARQWNWELVEPSPFNPSV